MSPEEWLEICAEWEDDNLDIYAEQLAQAVVLIRSVIEEAEEDAKEYNGPLDGGLRLSLAHVKRLRKALGMEVEEK